MQFIKAGFVFPLQDGPLSRGKKGINLGAKETYFRIEHEGSETIWKLKLVKCVSKASYPKGGRTFNLNAG